MRRSVGRLVFSCVLVVAVGVLTSCQSTEGTFQTVRYGAGDRSLRIASRGRAQVPELIAFFTKTNPRVDLERLSEIARAYLDEAAAEGINSDIAFCQMVHETDYLRFGGDAWAWQNNFCGLGVMGGGRRGQSFSSVRIGVRAHIQHLKAYADTEPLHTSCVDPRFGLVRRAGALRRRPRGHLGDRPPIRREAQAPTRRPGDPPGPTAGDGPRHRPGESGES